MCDDRIMDEFATIADILLSAKNPAMTERVPGDSAGTSEAMDQPVAEAHGGR
jgi:hypothetical protein